jgi:hypothetical protein
VSAKDPVDRSLIATHAVCQRWARATAEERMEQGAIARAGMDKRFEREVDPDGILPPAERARRIGLARRAYFAKLALKSAQVRRARKAAR